MPTTFAQTYGHKGSDLLADFEESRISSGRLDDNIYLPDSWCCSLLDFIASELPTWRDDPRRPDATAETILTSQLCAHMNSATRMSPGWDFIQFRIEEPDETIRSRRVDLVPAAVGTTIWIEDREYSHYASLVPIECKRLPTPSGTARDEREYLYSAQSSTGGVQRSKEGHHGATHSIGAMIAYIQENDIDFWTRKMGSWLYGLIASQVARWGEGDGLSIVRRDDEHRSAVLSSLHGRSGNLAPIRIHHLWIDMTY